MNKYLARIKTEKRPYQTTALTAKRALGSKGSAPYGRIYKINTLQNSQAIPVWCSTHCVHFDPVELPGRPPIPGCFREVLEGWLWRPLYNMRACPVHRCSTANHRGAPL